MITTTTDDLDWRYTEEIHTFLVPVTGALIAACWHAFLIQDDLSEQ